MKLFIAIAVIVMMTAIPCSAQSVSENDSEHKVLGRPVNSVGDIGDTPQVKDFRSTPSNQDPRKKLHQHYVKGSLLLPAASNIKYNLLQPRPAVGDFDSGLEKQKWWLRKIQATQLEKSVPKDKSFKDGKILHGYDALYRK